MSEDPPDEPEPEDARDEESDERDQVDSEGMRPRLREDADHRGAQEAAEDDERDGDAVRRLVDVVVDLVDARVLDVHLERPLAQLLEDVRDLVGHVPRDGREPERLDTRPLREGARMEAVGEQAARVRPSRPRTR